MEHDANKIKHNTNENAEKDEETGGKKLEENESEMEEEEDEYEIESESNSFDEKSEDNDTASIFEKEKKCAEPSFHKLENRDFNNMESINKFLYKNIMSSLEKNIGESFFRYVLNLANDENLLTSTSAENAQYFKDCFMSISNKVLNSESKMLKNVLTEELQNSFNLLNFQIKNEKISIAQIFTKCFSSSSTSRTYKFCLESDQTVENSLKILLLKFFIKPITDILSLAGGFQNSSLTSKLFDAIVLRVIFNRFPDDEINKIHDLEIAMFDKFLQEQNENNANYYCSPTTSGTSTATTFRANYGITRISYIKNHFFELVHKDDDVMNNIKKSLELIFKSFLENSKKIFLHGNKKILTNEIRLTLQNLEMLEELLFGIVRLEYLGLVCSGLFITLYKLIKRALNTGNFLHVAKTENIDDIQNMTKISSNIHRIKKIDSIASFTNNKKNSELKRNLINSILSQNNTFFVELIESCSTNASLLKHLAYLTYDCAADISSKVLDEKESSNVYVSKNFAYQKNKFEKIVFRLMDETLASLMTGEEATAAKKTQNEFNFSIDVKKAFHNLNLNQSVSEIKHLMEIKPANLNEHFFILFDQNTKVLHPTAKNGHVNNDDDNNLKIEFFLKMKNNQDSIKTIENLFREETFKIYITDEDKNSSLKFHVISTQNLENKIYDKFNNLRDLTNAICISKFDDNKFYENLKKLPNRLSVEGEKDGKSQLRLDITESYLKVVLSSENYSKESNNLTIYKYIKNSQENFGLLLTTYSTIITILETILEATSSPGTKFDEEYFEKLSDPLGEMFAITSCAHFTTTIDVYMAKAPNLINGLNLPNNSSSSSSFNLNKRRKISNNGETNGKDSYSYSISSLFNIDEPPLFSKANDFVLKNRPKIQKNDRSDIINKNKDVGLENLKLLLGND